MHPPSLPRRYLFGSGFASFTRRIDELWDQLSPMRDEAYMPLVRADARMIGESIEQLLEPSRG